jgi:hypothetical protein
MNSFELFFLSNDFSWVAARLIPYALFLLFGLLVSAIIVRKFHFKGHVRVLFLLSIPLVSLSVYFAIFPIYQGDFSNASQQFARSAQMKELKTNRLIILSLPGCPYCIESMERMRIVKQRHPNMTIEYKVCHGDSASLLWFKKYGKKEFEYSLASNIKMTSKLAQGLYPSYVLPNKSFLKVWSVEQFGLSAIDEVEESLSK